ncbi:hypothetical protein [Parvibaculum sp. MBR-TMA-1.3b-4.2]|jgi:hypothetical protein
MVSQPPDKSRQARIPRKRRTEAEIIADRMAYLKRLGLRFLADFEREAENG